MINTAFLGLGSNIGERKNYLQQALSILSKNNAVLAKSSIYQTPPWGYLAQKPFLNQVLKINTSLSPQELLSLCKEIELKIGRVPSFRYGPREIDVDILSYGELFVKEKNLIIPHPELHNRAFMLIPLQEIEPNFLHPLKLLSITEMLEGKTTDDIIKYSNQIMEENAKK